MIIKRMNKFFFTFFIIVFLFKTGNVFSKSTIFNVDNIVINSNKIDNPDQLFDQAVKKGFEKLVKKILLTKDADTVLTTSILDIKKLISSYQIIQGKKEKDKNKFIFNISFNRSKMNNFFSLKNISYADISDTNIVLFPILIKGNNFFLFSENYFFNNWNGDSTDKNLDFINYIMPIENLDDIEFINKNINNLESIDVKKFLSNYDVDDSILLIVKSYESKTDILLKGVAFEKVIVKNFNIIKSYDDQKKEYNFIIENIKGEIKDIWKSQNLIDIKAASFLNITLDISNQKDLLDLQKALNEIDLIENHYVSELNKNYAKIKIKYLGKVDKIKLKFHSEGIKVKIVNNEWKLRLK